MSNTDNTTPWFPGHVKPVRRGLYQRNTNLGEDIWPTWTLWDGKRWRMNSCNRFEAESAQLPSGWQSLPWRGLKEPQR